MELVTGMDLLDLISCMHWCNVEWKPAGVLSVKMLSEGLVCFIKSFITDNKELVYFQVCLIAKQLNVCLTINNSMMIYFQFMQYGFF